jgi:hypothetical protein
MSLNKYFSFIIAVLLSGQIFANTSLIKQVESLRNSIGLKDRQRPRLTLRLADLYFDHAAVLAQKDAENGILEATIVIKSAYKKSLKFYYSALNGEKGKFSKPNALTQFKIHFQVARLSQKLKDLPTAIKFYEKLLSLRVTNPKIIRETVLNLAEIYEGQQKFVKADEFYNKALTLCSKKELCSYIEYRRSWIYYRQGKMVKAIETIKKGLYDSLGNIKHQALQDFIMFMSQSTTDGEKELIEIEEFSIKHNQPEMMTALMEGFFGQGNRLAGITFLSYLNNKAPELFYQIRLMEENYGFRRWEEYQLSTSAASSNTLQKLTEKQSLKVKKILRRLVVQLDGERKTDAIRSIDLQNTVDLYLSIFNNDELRDKMTNGWMAAVCNDKKTDKVTPEKRLTLINKISLWLVEEIKLNRNKRITELRLKRLSLAQKDKNFSIVLEESKALEKIFLTNKKINEAREYSYLVARTHYEMRETAIALPIFQKLALLASDFTAQNIDKWALLSQNLALDVLNQNKNFSAIKIQADSWLNHIAFKGHNEFKEMKAIASQAKFQTAFADKESDNSLKVFRDYCLKDQFKDKSCANAKILAIKLNNQPILIEILKKTKDENSLIIEYEAMGEFKKAAYLIEKKNKKTKKKFDLKFYAKLAVFYEIENDLKQRDRIIRVMIKNIKKMKVIDEKIEAFVYSTLNDAKMINNKVLKLPWRLSKKMQIVHELELRGQGTKATKEKLLTSKTSLGDRWSLHILKNVVSLYEKQKKIGFYGRRSQRNFKKRIKKIEAFVKSAKSYLEGSDLKTRVVILNLLQKSYLELVNEITITPLPEGLETDQLNQIKIQLADMAAPYKLEGENYLTAKNEQLAQIEDLELKSKLTELYQDYKVFYHQKPNLPHLLTELNLDIIKNDFDKLKMSPNDRAALTNIQKYYATNNQPRIASYFKGRMLSL